MMSNVRIAFLARRLTVLFFAATLSFCANFSFAESAVCKTKGAVVKADYPDFARRMKITGAVRLELQLTASGSVRGSRILGGNPVLASSAQQAVKQAKFEGNEPCIIVFEFKQ